MSKNGFFVNGETEIDRATDGYKFFERVSDAVDGSELAAEAGVNVTNVSAYGEVSLEGTDCQNDGCLETNVYAGAQAGLNSEAYAGGKIHYSQSDVDGFSRGVTGVMELRTGGGSRALVGVEAVYQNPTPEAGKVDNWKMGVSGGYADNQLGGVAYVALQVDIREGTSGMTDVFARAAVGPEGQSVRVGVGHDFSEPIGKSVLGAGLGRVEVGVQCNSGDNALVSSQDQGFGAGFGGQGCNVGVTAKFTF
ncbi:MAG: hypothetical protein H6861_08785 [Rhodospirillales bacterium]|nr:hypothetical protein [Rhodospirillales bacterium]